MRTSLKLTPALLALLLVAGAASGAAGPVTNARLLLSHQAARPGETVWAGVQFRLPPDWHIYWENSGDSGIPTRIEWNSSNQVAAGSLLWPVPERFEAAGLITYGYSQEVMLLAPLTVASNARPGRLEIKAKATWLECIAEKCAPGAAPLQAWLDVQTESRLAPDAPLLDRWRAKLPAPKPAGFAQARWEKEAGEDSVRPLVIEWSPDASTVDGDFYSFTLSNAQVRTTVQKLDASAGRLRLRKEMEKVEGAWPTELAGLLIERGPGSKERAFQTSIVVSNSSALAKGGPDAAPMPRASGVGPEKKPFVVWLGFALLGGLILNLMPCVLPVIALKIFGFVGQSQDSPARVRQLGLIYMLGVLCSFLVLGGLVVGLKSAGQHVSWGMQFGDARLLVILTTLVTLVALNLFGIFEVTLSGDTMSAASTLAAKEGAGGAFFNGVLATVLSTPCSAPFLASALGFAFAPQTTSVTIFSIFLTIGLGLALPYVVLSFEPRWLRFLPKPGPWMEKFKVLMGFPMLATAVWLFTLTSSHYHDVLWLGFFLVILALAAWVFGQFVQHGTKRKPLALGITALLLLIGYGYGLESKQRWRYPRPPSLEGAAEEVIKDGPDGIEWRRWTPARVQQARAQGRPVFVDFTADWCVTCNLNKNTSIEIDSVRKKLKEINALPLLGDYTRFPPEITEELQRFGRAAVPLVLVYPRDASQPPIELPAILTPGIVLDALDKAAR